MSESKIDKSLTWDEYQNQLNKFRAIYLLTGNRDAIIEFAMHYLFTQPKSCPCGMPILHKEHVDIFFDELNKTLLHQLEEPC